MPASRTFAPLVLLIAAIVPGLYAWFYGTVTVEQAVWGLRGLEVLGGQWLRPVAAAESLPPPVFAWAQAAALAIPFVNPLWLLPLPAYAFGLLAVGMLYRIGRVAFTPGVGLLACFLFGLNQFFLRQLQTGGPETCVLAWCLVGLHLYQLHLAGSDEVFAPRTMLGVLAFALLVLSSGGFGFWLPMSALLHQVYLRMPGRGEVGSGRPADGAALFAGLVVIGGGLILAAPWLLAADWHLGPFVPFASPAAGAPVQTPASLIAALPAMIVLGLYGGWRALRDALKASAESGPVLVLLWILISLAWLRVSGGNAAAALLAVAGLTLLAARTLIGILHRELHDRRVLALMLLATATFVICKAGAFGLVPSWLAGRAELTGQQRLDLHLAIDALVLTVTAVAALYRYSARRESSRRLLLAGFVLATMALSVLPGATRFTGSRRVDDRWQLLYERLSSVRADRIVIVGADGAGRSWTPLHFIGALLYPGVPREYVAGRTELIQLLSSGADRYPLVFVVEPAHRLAKSTAIARSGETITLAEIYASDQWIAYAADGTGAPRPAGLVAGATE